MTLSYRSRGPILFSVSVRRDPERVQVPHWGHDREWQLRAACRNADPEPFFTLRREDQAGAKRICGSCPVLEECRELIDRLEASLPRHLMFGLWAGESVSDRVWRRRLKV